MRRRAPPTTVGERVSSSCGDCDRRMRRVHRLPGEHQHRRERDAWNHRPGDLASAPSVRRAGAGVRRTRGRDDGGTKNRQLGDRATRDGDPEDRVSETKRHGNEGWATPKAAHLAIQNQPRGERRTGNGENRERRTGNGEPGTANRERRTGNGEPGTANRRRATGAWGGRRGLGAALRAGKAKVRDCPFAGRRSRADLLPSENTQVDVFPRIRLEVREH